jgi:hypothetical protein
MDQIRRANINIEEVQNIIFEGSRRRQLPACSSPPSRPPNW